MEEFPKSHIFFGRNFLFSKKFFKYKFLFCTKSESKNYFENLGVPSVKLISNLKFINNSNEIDKSEYLSLKKVLSKKLVITLFSSHEDEELMLINCYNNLKIHKFIFIIIPRMSTRENK